MLQDYQTVKRVAIEHALQTFGIPEDKIAGFQKLCQHNGQPWVEVNNVPAELRQYEADDQDWICMTCGAQVPAF